MSSSNAAIEALVKQVEQFAAAADETVRDTLRITLRNLQYSLEGPNDTINRFGYYVSRFDTSVQFSEINMIA